MKRRLLILSVLFAAIAVQDLRTATRVTITGNFTATGNFTITERPFDAHDVPGLVAWYKPESLSAYGDGAAVGTWPDSSGNGYDLTQTDAGHKPTNWLSQLNGYAGVKFDGAVGGMTNRAMVWTNTFSGDDMPGTFFIVGCRANSNVNNSAFFALFDNKGASNFWLYQHLSTDKSTFYKNDTALRSAAMVTGIGTNWMTLSLEVSNASVFMWKNGTANSANPVALDSSIVPVWGISVGHRFTEPSTYNNPSAMTVCEFLIYSNALSIADRQTVENGLRAKYKTW